MLLIIGLDGADWRFLTPWLQDGSLPHLARIFDNGLRANLRSTIRPESSTAWSTFATGVNPGHHGIFGFVGQHPHDYRFRLNTASSLRKPSFWLRASRQGKRVALLNVPMTYPPQPFAGGNLVAGMLTPSTRSTFTYPETLREGLLQAAPRYTINAERSGYDLRRFIQEIRTAIKARGNAAKWLIGRSEWDAFVLVFTATDRLQHFSLHLFDPTHPRYDAEGARQLLPEILLAYQDIDHEIGSLVEAAGSEATVLVLSDHGFAPFARTFYPNVWLEQQGWLQYDSEAKQTADIWQKLRSYPTLRRLKRAMPYVRDVRREQTPGQHLANVDWSVSSAVYSPTGGIRLNIRGREPQGILDISEIEPFVNELVEALADLKDPETGAPVVDSIYRREELYEGPHLDLAPDIILEPRRADANAALNTSIHPGVAPSYLDNSGEYTGNHTLNGIFMAAGPGMKNGSLENARLLDMAPTILHTLGLPLSPCLEGQVLDLWDQPPAPTWLHDSVEPTDSERIGLAPGEEAKVEDRLRKLGYL